MLLISCYTLELVVAKRQFCLKFSQGKAVAPLTEVRSGVVSAPTLPAWEASLLTPLSRPQRKQCSGQAGCWDAPAPVCEALPGGTYPSGGLQAPACCRRAAGLVLTPNGAFSGRLPKEGSSGRFAWDSANSHSGHGEPAVRRGGDRFRPCSTLPSTQHLGCLGWA